MCEEIPLDENIVGVDGNIVQQTNPCSYEDGDDYAPFDNDVEAT